MPEIKRFESIKRDVLQNGGFFVHYYFDMHASNAEALNSIMVGFVGKLTKEEGVQMAVGEIEEPMLLDKMYSSTARVSMLARDFETLVRLAMAYGPIGVEIEEPTEVKLPAHEVQTALIGISATSQELTHHILTKTMTPEERQKFDKQMEQRSLLGAELMKKAGGTEEAK